jgi:hypothetical protein
MPFSFLGRGWKVNVVKRGYSYRLPLAKEVVIGNGLRLGHSLYYFLVKYEGRMALLVYLDGKDRGGHQ